MKSEIEKELSKLPKDTLITIIIREAHATDIKQELFDYYTSKGDVLAKKVEAYNITDSKTLLESVKLHEECALCYDKASTCLYLEN